MGESEGESDDGEEEEGDIWERIDEGEEEDGERDEEGTGGRDGDEEGEEGVICEEEEEDEEEYPESERKRSLGGEEEKIPGVGRIQAETPRGNGEKRDLGGKDATKPRTYGDRVAAHEERREK